MIGRIISVCNCFSQDDDTLGEIEMQGVKLESNFANEEISVRNNTFSGSGSIYANVALHQDQAYFEITLSKFPSGAEFCIGVSSKLSKSNLKKDLNEVDKAWCFSSELCTAEINEGDVIGCGYDQLSGKTRVDFYRNGILIPGCSVAGVKGTVYPAFSVKDGAEICANFAIEASDFKFDPPRNFGGVIPTRNIM